MKKIVFFLVALILFNSCAVKQHDNVIKFENQDHLLLSVLWFQKSAEMRALFYQGYNIAERSLTEKLQNRSSEKAVAVIMDIDETILDNSPSEVYLIKNNIIFSDLLWKHWVDKAAAGACPGALDFVKFAESQKVEVFYISNREMPGELQPTILNLQKLGFPFADTAHLILKTVSSSKELRRTDIAEKYEILMYIGDNLADFNVIFDYRGENLGFGEVDRNRNKFGMEFIILPNPMYGPWINAAIQDQPGGTIKGKILNSLRDF